MIATTTTEDFNRATRMPLGDHLDELSLRLRRALASIVVVLAVGITADLIGMQTGRKEVGFAFPVLRLMTAPAEEEVNAFYLRRYEEIVARTRAREHGPGIIHPRPARPAR